MAWWPVGKLSICAFGAKRKEGRSLFDLYPSYDLLIEFPVLANKRGQHRISR
jgi:hypothetical protein